MNTHQTSAESQRIANLQQSRREAACKRGYSQFRSWASFEIEESSVGFTAEPLPGKPSDYRSVKLTTRDQLRALATVVNAVVELMKNPDEKVFEVALPPDESAVLRNRKCVLKKKLSASLMLAAINAPFEEILRDLPHHRIHPYFLVMYRAVRWTTLPRIKEGLASSTECHRLNLAVDRVRELTRDLGPLALGELVSLRESARKNRMDMLRYADRLLASAEPYHPHCFVAGHLDDIPVGLPTAQSSVDALALSLNRLNEHRVQFQSHLRTLLQESLYLLAVGAVWRYECCRAGGPRMLLVVLMPEGHPMSDHSYSIVLRAWSQCGFSASYVSPSIVGLVDPTRFQVQPDCVEQLIGRLLDRFVEVDAYAKLDLKKISETSKVNLEVSKTMGKVIF